MSVKNRAFVFIKPSANILSVQAFVSDWLLAKGFKITARGNLSGNLEEEFEIQFVNTGRKAMTLKPFELNVPVEGLAVFQQCYGLSWSACLEEGLIRNALETMDILGIDPATLLREWMQCVDAGTMVRLSRHMYCALIDMPDRPAIFCINGYYPALRSEFISVDASIHYYCVEWDDKIANWHTFLLDVIGSADPEVAQPTSLRGVIHAEWSELGLPSPLDKFYNALNVSASAFEAFAQHLNWLKINVNNDPLGCYLYQLGLTPQTLKDWLANIPIRGKYSFDYFEHKGSVECIEVVRDIVSQAADVQSHFIRLRRGGNQEDFMENRRNAALLYVKPHANTPEVRTLVEDFLRNQGFIVSEEREINAQLIDKDLLVDKQYASIARMALFLSPKDYKFSPKSYIRFQKKFGTSWCEQIEKNNVCNAGEMLLRLEITQSQLSKAWNRCMQDGTYIKLEREVYCGYINTIRDKPPLFCINGFYLAMRAQYLTPKASIYCYTVEWEDDLMTWNTFLRDIIGATNPDMASENSLRDQLNHKWMELNVKGPLNIQNNGIHVSSSAFEAMVERSIWFQQSLKKDENFGKRLLSEGIPVQTLRDWSMNCIVREARIFDHMLHLGADDCIAKALELLKIAPDLMTNEIVPFDNTSSVNSLPHFPSIPNKAVAKSGSKSLNRRLFERAMAQDFQDFEMNEFSGAFPSNIVDTQRPLTQSKNSYQIQPHHRNFERIQITRQNMSYEKTVYTDAEHLGRRTGARDRYINDAVTMEEGEHESNDLDHPATVQSDNQHFKKSTREKSSGEVQPATSNQSENQHARKTSQKYTEHSKSQETPLSNTSGPTINHILPEAIKSRKVMEI